MLMVITGGSGSGKSEFAEKQAVRLAEGGPLIYLATMQVYGEEGRKKVERHRRLRKGKGFATIERTTRVDLAEPEAGATVLLECMTNLAANEMFSGDGTPEAVERAQQDPEEAEISLGSRILENVERLYAKCRNLVIVTGEVASDGISYDESTESYIRLLQRVNCGLCQKAEEAYEVVYTIPVCLKKKPEDAAVGKEVTSSDRSELFRKESL